MEHIVEFLRSMDELQMAEEVSSAANRLNAFAENLDKDCFDAQVIANKSLSAENERLKLENASLQIFRPARPPSPERVKAMQLAEADFDYWGIKLEEAK